MHNLTKILIFFIISSASAVVFAKTMSDKTISERTAFVGEANRPGDAVEQPQPVMGSSAKKTNPRTGEEIYNTACTICHASGVAGAPKFGNAADWAPRIAKGLDVLVKSSIDGIGAMPSRGMCMQCSTGEIKSAIEYMLENSK